MSTTFETCNCDNIDTEIFPFEDSQPTNTVAEKDINEPELETSM